MHMWKEKVKRTVSERYGVDNVSKLDEIKEKKRDTCLKNHGVESGFQLRDKIEETCLERYGVKHARQSPEVIEKYKKTCIEHYGVDNPFKSDDVKKKIRQTTFDHFGVEYSMQSEEVKEKSRSTCLERYGVECQLQTQHAKENAVRSFREKFGVDRPMLSEEFREHMRECCRNKYGVDYPLQSDVVKMSVDWKSARQKAHETMKREGTYGKSVAEDHFYEALCCVYGANDVERQIDMNGWSIDFHVVSIDTYVQFDGVYWHGLDRPIEAVRECVSSRDGIIARTWEIDREQERWFREHRLRLVRVTDEEYRNSPINAVKKVSDACLDSS